MSCILHIDTSTNVCSVAVSENGGVIFNKENHSGPNHAESLGSDVDEALSFADSHAIPVDAVAISSGPGSYTGLRIGVSMAKGICYGQGLHLVSVPTLELLCVPVLLRHDEMEENALLVPMRRPIVSILTEVPSISLAMVRRSAWRSSTTPMPISSKA